jgi:3-oxoadipate enol-lactonase
VSELGHDLTGPPDRPVLVLGSSLGTDRRMWDPQLAALAGRYRVLRYDHRGHGTSAVPAGPYRIADLAGDLLGLLDRLGVERCDYAGLSLGGMVGMWLAAHHPERVGRLALLCTSAFLPPAGGWQDRARVARTEGTAALVEASLGRWFTPGFVAARPDVVHGLADGLATTPDEGYAGCCEAIAGMDLRADLPSITAPTLVVAGRSDPSTPPEHAEVIGRLVPDCRVELVDAAHLASVEAAERCQDLLLDHLEAP